MTSVYSAEGKNIPCTVIEAGPCVVTQIKTVEKDTYPSTTSTFFSSVASEAARLIVVVVLPTPPFWLAIAIIFPIISIFIGSEISDNSG